MEHLKKRCLSCKYFRPKTITDGLCRKDTSLAPDYQVTAHGDICEMWKTSGQQYYIRSGWLKRQIQLVEGE
ncbi:hypothetical protein [Desulfosediminicola flagellatus]|uniref:hypothetical protein n=1 Tax=Desulfosediminicola flagellatus TaxID=2569541 RepID=UPI0010AD881E|nr:hypothetical protein [Desulfosediminicola flagellatus]